MERLVSPDYRFELPTRKTLRKLRRVCKQLADEPDRFNRSKGWVSSSHPLENGSEAIVIRRLRRAIHIPIITVIIADPPLQGLHQEQKYEWLRKRKVNKWTNMRLSDDDVDLSNLAEELGEDIDLRGDIEPELASRIIQEESRQFHEQQIAEKQEEELGLSLVSDEELREVIDLLHNIKS